MVSSAALPRSTCMPEAANALRSASFSVRAMPIASPVDFISGPRYESTAGSLFIEKTGAFTATRSRGGTSPVAQPRSASFSPSITPVASFTIGTPVTLERNGTVREERGFTSST